MDNFMDTLIALGAKKGSRVIPLISPADEKIPDAVKEQFRSAGAVLFAYSKGVVDAIADITPAILLDKSAFEVYGAGGLMAMDALAKYAHKKGIIVIIDGCFGGNGSSLDNYIESYLTTEADDETTFFADAITISPFNDANAIKNAASYVASNGKALLMTLRQTRSSDKTQFENIITKNDEQELYYSAADDAGAFGENYIGEKGYSALGMITYATKDLAKIRNMNRWAIGFTRINMTELDDDSYYGFFYKDEGEGQFMVISDDIVFAYRADDSTYMPENYADAAYSAMKHCVDTVEKHRKG